MTQPRHEPIKQINPVNGEEVILQPVYIVDAENDPQCPILVKVEITAILKDGGENLEEYLGTLLSDACDGQGYNMAFAKTEEAARQILQDETGSSEV